MHASVREYVGHMVAVHGMLEIRHPSQRVGVLEVGSYNVNGSVRDLFPDTYYRGVDIRSGPGVDHVTEPGHLFFPACYFDVVVSTETLEHDLRPWQTMAEIRRVARRPSWLILTARGFSDKGVFGRHDHPGDHYRFSVEALAALVGDSGFEVEDARPDPEAPGVFLVARG